MAKRALPPLAPFSSPAVTLADAEARDTGISVFVPLALTLVTLIALKIFWLAHPGKLDR